MSQGQGLTTQPITEMARFPNGNNSGSTTLVAGISPAISFPGLTANSRIFCTRRVANTSTLTVGGYSAPQSLRVLSTTPPTFQIQAEVAAGTINVADVSTIDYLVIP